MSTVRVRVLEPLSNGKKTHVVDKDVPAFSPVNRPLVITQPGVNGYTITHVASGLKLGWVPSLAAARRVLKVVTPLADWTKPSEDIAKDAELGEKIKAAFLVEL
jgi:hypothetical protein